MFALMQIRIYIKCVTMASSHVDSSSHVHLLRTVVCYYICSTAAVKNMKLYTMFLV